MHHRVIRSSISFTILTYYATFWPETGLKPKILDWPGKKKRSEKKREVLTPIWGAWCIWNWLTKVIVLI